MPKAVLFTGPVGVGKRSLVFALAKHLATRGMEPGSEKYNRGIGKIERGTHPDVLVVEPKSASGQILRDQIDEMHERAWYAPLESPSRIIIINPAEAMNATSANNLLKLLEEPPPNLYLLLSCKQVHRVLPTILSRCAQLRCQPVELPVLTSWLMSQAGCPKRKAETAARLSGGRPGLATELLSGEDETRRRNLTHELDLFHRDGYPTIFRVAHHLLGAFDTADETVAALLVWFRDLLIASLTAGETPGASLSSATAIPLHAIETSPFIINGDLATEIASAAARHTPQKLAETLRILLERQERSIGPMVDGELLMQVLLTKMGVALK